MAAEAETLSNSLEALEGCDSVSILLGRYDCDSDLDILASDNARAEFMESSRPDSANDGSR